MKLNEVWRLMKCKYKLSQCLYHKPKQMKRLPLWFSTHQRKKIFFFKLVFTYLFHSTFDNFFKLIVNMIFFRKAERENYGPLPEIYPRRHTHSVHQICWFIQLFENNSCRDFKVIFAFKIESSRSNMRFERQPLLQT